MLNAKILAKIHAFVYNLHSSYIAGTAFFNAIDHIIAGGIPVDQVYSMKLSTLVETLKLDVVAKSTDYESVEIKSSDTHRPGLQLCGFYDYFDPSRIQLLGKMETNFLEMMPIEQQIERIDTLFAKKIPAVIFCHDTEPNELVIRLAKENDITLLQTSRGTSELLEALITTLKAALAPRITRHGVLVEVYGEGLLLLGESGVGKSEAAIELLKRGHRLIADDAVEIKRIGPNMLQGTAPDLIRHYIELRGIGVIDVRRIFGMGAVKSSEKIDLVIYLEPWKEGMLYDRLGINNTFTSILDVEVPCLTIPLKPGRNLAVILEVAAMNHRQRKMGYNAALEFTQQINKHWYLP